MPEVVDWQNRGGARLPVQRALQTLLDGRLVAFPTETTYVLAAGIGATDLLRRQVGADGAEFALAVRGPEELRDWAPGLAPLGHRLARRCWPGPLTLVCDGAAPDGLARRLPAALRDWFGPEGAVALWHPAHEAILRVLRLLPGPLLLAAKPGGAMTAGEAGGAEVDLVLDAGPTRYGGLPTRVRVRDGGFTVLREGVLSAEDLTQQAVCVIIFVCTGNTCRSPLAEALFKKVLAERLQCDPRELPRRGYIVVSAGLSALPGGPPAAESVEAARERGADLSQHSSRPLTAELAAQADYLIAMTRGHQQALLGQFARSGASVRLLSPRGEDVADPIGCEQDVYRACAQQIWDHLEGWADELLGTRPVGQGGLTPS